MTVMAHALGLGAALSGHGGGEPFLTVAGYASLVDERSARETVPTLRRFRRGTVRDHCRIFNLVSIINLSRGLASGRRLATATARPQRGSDLLVALFDLPLSELPALLARERRLRVCCVPYEEAGGARGHAALFGEYTHAEYLSERCGGDLHAYHNEVGRWYPDGEIYRPDLLPVPSYVLRCVRAHRVAGPAALANLLDESFLGDGETSLRTQLRRELQPQCAPEKQGAGDPPLGGDDSPWTEAERQELRSALGLDTT